MPESGIYKRVPLGAIKVGTRFRENVKGVEALAESMNERLIYPIILNSNYELIDGGRRYAAAELLSWEDIPCLIRSENEEIDLRELELLGNLEREDFTWIEEVKLLQEIHDLHMKKDSSWSGRKTAIRLGKSKSIVSKKLRLAGLIRDNVELGVELSIAKTEAEAEKMVNTIEENLALTELTRRNEAKKAERKAGREQWNKEARELSAKVDRMMAEHKEEKKAAGTYVETDAEKLQRETLALISDSDSGYIISDFFDVAKALPDEFLGPAALIECDPDFGIDPSLFLKRTKAHEAYTGVPKKLYPGFLERLCHECFRLLGDGSTMLLWFGIEWYKEAREALKYAGFTVNLNPAIWYKPGPDFGTVHAPKKLLANVTEFFFVAQKGDAFLGTDRASNVFEFLRPRPGDRIHPTEKPVELTKQIISTCYRVHPGSRCLIPFLGSGNGLQACRDLGIEAFGCDLSTEYKNKYLLRYEDKGE